MAFRRDDEALRARVSSLEGELERAKDEAAQLRRERDRALAPSPPPTSPTEPPPPAEQVMRPRAPIQRRRWGLIALLFASVLFWLLHTPTPPRTHGLWSTSSLRVGQVVLTEWSGRYYPAHVLAVHGTSVRVHYDGLPTTDDEDVSFWRIRVRDR